MGLKMPFLVFWHIDAVFLQWLSGFFEGYFVFVGPMVESMQTNAVVHCEACSIST